MEENFKDHSPYHGLVMHIYVLLFVSISSVNDLQFHNSKYLCIS